MKTFPAIGFAAVFLLAMVVTLFYLPSTNNEVSQPAVSSTPQTALTFDSSKTLEDYFESIAYRWPISGSDVIPTTLIQSMPADIGTLTDIKKRKTLFIRIMLPIIVAEQQRIRDKRQTLKLALQFNHANNPGNHHLQKELNKLFTEYKISNKLSYQEKGKALLQRFDELPLALVLAQAAMESGWGTSRFTRVGNSLFGEWTYEKGTGIVPQGRDPGKTHKIKAFPSLQASIASYVKNINRNNAYKELRQQRSEMRLKQQALDARKLAQGLQRYSQKGQAYVVSLLQILNSKEFRQIEALNLD